MAISSRTNQLFYANISAGVRGGFATILILFVSALTAAQGRIVETRVSSVTLKNLLGDSTERNVLVYLPPSYDRTPDKRFPAVFLLHSFGAGNGSWLGGQRSYEGFKLPETLDRSDSPEIWNPIRLITNS